MRGRVEISGINTAKLPVLKNDEMTALLRRAHAGDTAAREQLICGNLRLVLSVLQRFAGRGESADDLFQVGCIGLMKAIDNFDVEQPVRFSTYGVPMIVGEIRRYLRDNSALRISRSMRDTAYKILRAREALLVETQREPTVEQLGAVSGYSAGGRGVRHGRVQRSGEFVRAAVCRQRGHGVRHGPGAGREEHRRELAGPHRAEGRHSPVGPAAAEHTGAAVLPGEDADGGQQRDRHLTGAGVTTGKDSTEQHQEEYVSIPRLRRGILVSFASFEKRPLFFWKSLVYTIR